MVWRGVFIIAMTLPAQLAEAKTCHHYSLWRYPFPQANCQETPHRTWFVKIASKPSAPSAPSPEDLTRAQAIETLKQELRRRTTQALELQTLGLTMEEKRNGD